MPTRRTSRCWSAALGGLAEKFGLKGEAVDEVMGGAVISHSRDFNVAREAALDAGYSPRTPGTNLQIACGTSLQAALNLGAKIATGEIESGDRVRDRYGVATRRSCSERSSSTGWWNLNRAQDTAARSSGRSRDSASAS